MPDVSRLPSSRGKVKEHLDTRITYFFEKRLGNRNRTETVGRDEVDIGDDHAEIDDQPTPPQADGAQMRLDVMEKNEAGDSSFSDFGGGDKKVITLLPSPTKTREEAGAGGALTVLSQ